jgi:hypothetical protein
MSSSNNPSLETVSYIRRRSTLSSNRTHRGNNARHKACPVICTSLQKWMNRKKSDPEENQKEK